MTNKKLIRLVLLILFISLVIVTFVNSPTQTWKHYMKTASFEEAVDVYLQNTEIDTDILDEELHSAILNIKNEFKKQTLSYQDAITHLNTLSAMNYKEELIIDAKDYVNRLNDSSVAYANGEKMYEAQEYEQAIAYYTQVDFEDINYENATTKINDSISMYKNSVITEADALQLQHSYDTATDLINHSIAFISQTTNIQDTELADYHNKLCYNAMSYYEQQATEFEQKNDLIKAIDSLQIAKNFDLDNTKNYDTQINVLYDKYFDGYIAEADAVFQIPQEHYLLAASVLEPIMKAYPNEPRLKEKYYYYLSFEPVTLFETNPFQKSTYFSSLRQNALDNKGNEHKYMYSCGSIYTMDANWKLGGKYDLLTGVIGVPNGNYDTDVNGKIRLYGDGNLLWEQTGINDSTSPKNISVDISGVDVLQIYMEGGTGPLRKCSVMVADFVVQKTIK